MSYPCPMVLNKEKHPSPMKDARMVQRTEAQLRTRRRNWSIIFRSSIVKYIFYANVMYPEKPAG